MKARIEIIGSEARIPPRSELRFDTSEIATTKIAVIRTLTM
jgi:hypothetical protein